MGTLQIQNINLAYGDRDLLKNVSFTLSQESRAALAGGNGSGKSTLLKIISGSIVCDSGTITLTKGLRISYLPQSDIVYGSRKVYAEVETGYDRFLVILEEMRELEEQLANASPSDNIQPILIQHHDYQELMMQSTYYQREAVIEQVLFGLGFSRVDLNRPCDEFSGGWQMRIALAKVLVEDPDMMLLDEPTNYLDIEARIWLKNYLKQYSGGVMIVSHDQNFLDETVTEVFELFKGNLSRYSGNYSSYLVQRDLEIQQLEEGFRLQQLKIEKTEQFIERFRYKATKAKQVQSRAKQLEKIDIIEVPSHLKKLSFTFPPPPHCGNDVVVIQDLEKHYADLSIFKSFDLIVNKGDRLAVTGRNGAGKSTLLRMIAGIDADYSGRLATGAGVHMGYFAQDTEATLNPHNTVYDEVAAVATTADIPRLRNMLGSFLFSDDDIHKSVSVLSGGERSRLALLKILLHPANLLVLDEPTNHLDINAKQMLLEALGKYSGTIVFVSHDSHFIKNIANRILYLSDQLPEVFEGDYEYFSWKLEQKEQVERIVGGKAKDKATSIPPPSHNQLSPPSVATSFSAEQRKEANRLKNRLRNLRMESDAILLKTGRIEQDITQVLADMALPENYSDSKRITQLVRNKDFLQKEHDALSEQWFALHEEIDCLEVSNGI